MRWDNTQLDEVSLPIVLAWWLDRTGPTDWKHVRKAADYVVANGPETPQERWENQDGWSPNTIATEIAGLICAADIARENGAPGRAATYERTADRWQRRVEAWTATTNSPFYSPTPYYLRVTKDAEPQRRQHLRARRQLPAPGRRARGGRPELPRAGPVRGQARRRPDGAQLARGRRRGARRRRPRAARSGIASPSTATARRAPAATGTSSRRPSARRWAACGRCSPASAPSTSCSPAATRRPTWTRSPPPPTTA